MNKLFILLMPFLLWSCASQFNKGVIAKKELRSKKPPSVRIAEDFDKKAKKQKVYTNPKKAARAREKEAERIKKRGNKYLKKKKK